LDPELDQEASVTRGQRLRHARIWLVLAPLLALALVLALMRREATLRAGRVQDAKLPPSLELSP
jgi:hypothetical protein